ncbi:hypothetical protein LK08_11945 [Streptomyces sp. MUSC 125]|uniref:hypothetical protein n=1 Tax=Streptomyces TaxID=1883 RepID=UPI000573CFC5|nr:MULTISPECIES: hypothetical protein [Streptomyces]KIE26923.1 hypothetical protein LK08_11945 [Streptomyces sp. MUSC 125]
MSGTILAGHTGRCPALAAMRAAGHEAVFAADPIGEPEIERTAERYAGAPRIHHVGPLLWDPDLDGVFGRRLDSFGTPDEVRVYLSVGGRRSLGRRDGLGRRRRRRR